MTATTRLHRKANYRRRLERTQPVAWTAASAAAAQLLPGDPNPRLSNSRERCWGRKGSLALNLETGFWKDYEANETGDTLPLIARQTGWSPQPAMEWLVEQGIIPPRPEEQPNPTRCSAATENSRLNGPADGSQAKRPGTARTLRLFPRPRPCRPPEPPPRSSPGRSGSRAGRRTPSPCRRR